MTFQSQCQWVHRSVVFISNVWFLPCSVNEWLTLDLLRMQPGIYFLIFFPPAFLWDQLWDCVRTVQYWWLKEAERQLDVSETCWGSDKLASDKAASCSSSLVELHCKHSWKHCALSASAVKPKKCTSDGMDDPFAITRSLHSRRAHVHLLKVGPKWTFIKDSPNATPLSCSLHRIGARLWPLGVHNGVTNLLSQVLPQSWPKIDNGPNRSPDFSFSIKADAMLKCSHW